jgi:outer membrane protein OmpA-like peptidoglycan-associated protein
MLRHWLVLLTLTTCGCADRIVIKDVHPEPDTMDKLADIAKAQGCTTKRDQWTPPEGRPSVMSWAYNRLIAQCGEQEVILIQDVSTLGDINTVYLEAPLCTAGCKVYVDRFVAAFKAANMKPIKVERPTASSAPPADECKLDGADVVVVPAKESWKATGISLNPGDEVAVEACGKVHTCEKGGCGNACYAKWTGPEGLTSCPKLPLKAPDAPVMALVGRIGQSGGFEIGSKSSFTASSAGELALATNDEMHGDNGGAFKVRLTVRKKPTVDVAWTGAFFGDTSIGTMVTRCESKGQEVCGNGLDDDCSGSYDDVACDITQAPVMWTLLWSGPADLDLHIVGPDGIEVFAGNPRGASAGVVLDKSCTGSTNGSPCWEHAWAPGTGVGTYRAWVVVNDLRGAPEAQPIAVHFAGRIGSHVWYNDLSLAPTVGAAWRMAFAAGPDGDSDGVGDTEDACPTAAGRWSDDRGARGCPDGDQDGVPDKDDACPDKRGLTQADRSKNGCPMVFGDAWVTNSGVTITSRIEFDTGKSTLRKPAKNTLDNVAKAMQARPGSVRRMAVEGHTDNVGKRPANLGLSLARAKAVRDYLITKGITADSLVAQGFADLRPVADNGGDKGRQANRRVDFVISDPRPQAPERW